ncbi:hypothetical protein TrST_g6943 [Triparma strigata]|uniref:Uncharacterized protein n=1 Tax=Triparma strigata TaxID=1606541 RepID=A0A9W7C0N2_9STRA|nr:hypothetical protein TrST_g6943 [Triparma strigata]
MVRNFDADPEAGSNWLAGISSLEGILIKTVVVGTLTIDLLLLGLRYKYSLPATICGLVAVPVNAGACLLVVASLRAKKRKQQKKKNDDDCW